MSLDLAPAIFDALVADSFIASSIAPWENSLSIHTRRPVPEDAPYPMILIAPDVSIADEDWLIAKRPVIVRDILIYGKQPDHYRLVEQIGYAVRMLFHSKRFSIIPIGYAVVDITARGPMPAPVDDEQEVGRMVSLTIRLRRTP